jgi:L-alanine-DL-glutamate epimerase-like enolase superfamily enzyme
MQTRRNFLHKSGLITAGLFTLPRLQNLESFTQDSLPNWPLPDLKALFPEIIKIESVELLKTKGELMLVVKANGQIGVTQCNDRMQHLVSLLKGLVLPHFVGKDARDLPQLVDNAYRLNSNYKYAGMPLWNCIGSVEIAVWDLLGKIAQKPVYELLGKPIRTDYPVYISDFNREGDPEKIAYQLLEKLQATGARGVKIKVGGRMVNTPENAAQTRKYVPLLRKVLGNDITIYADANGSYTPREGIEAGIMLEDNGVAIFEEPCNFEDEEGMKTVTKALSKIVLAGGEQDSSLYRFQRLVQTKVYDLLQPDMYYNGGILRTLQVAEIAKQYGAVGIAPHTPKADPLIAPFWQVAALIPNLYGLQEFVYNPGEKRSAWHSEIKIKDGKMEIPSRIGLGIEYEPSIWKSAEKIA